MILLVISMFYRSVKGSWPDQRYRCHSCCNSTTSCSNVSAALSTIHVTSTTYHAYPLDLIKFNTGLCSAWNKESKFSENWNLASELCHTLKSQLKPKLEAKTLVTTQIAIAIFLLLLSGYQVVHLLHTFFFYLKERLHHHPSVKM